MAKLGFIGLGVMGYPMAGHLSRVGHDVSVFNRHQEKAEMWCREYGGHLAETPFRVAQGKDVVFCCVSKGSDVRCVAVGPEGAFAAMQPNTVFVDHSTISAHEARELYAIAHESDIGFLDAPVSGGQAGAQKGKLTIMCGGDAEIFAKTREIMTAYALSIRHTGASGCGQLCKMVNQVCLAGVIQGLSEGLAFGVKAGLDMATTVEIIRNGAASSWQLENRAATMLAGEFDFGFAVDLMRKDLGICLEEAKKNGAELPITALIDQFYAAIQNEKGGRLDTSSLITLLLKKAKAADEGV